MPPRSAIAYAYKMYLSRSHSYSQSQQYATGCWREKKYTVFRQGLMFQQLLN